MVRRHEKKIVSMKLCFHFKIKEWSVLVHTVHDILTNKYKIEWLKKIQSHTTPDMKLDSISTVHMYHHSIVLMFLHGPTTDRQTDRPTVCWTFAYWMESEDNCEI